MSAHVYGLRVHVCSGGGVGGVGSWSARKQQPSTRCHIMYLLWFAQGGVLWCVVVWCVVLCCGVVWRGVHQKEVQEKQPRYTYCDLFDAGDAVKHLCDLYAASSRHPAVIRFISTAIEKCEKTRPLNMTTH